MTLHDQLERLAERAEDTGPTGGELWDRGTRYRRRIKTGTAAIAAGTLLGLAVLTGVSIVRAGPVPEPIPADAPAGLPSQLWKPSPWLPGSAEVGPPGQVVALVEDQLRRSWWGAEYGVVAVSAATGDYRFLDLPDLASGDFGPDAVLAPDGRHVAYWTTGPTTDRPNTSGHTGGRPVAGLALYDTLTGGVRRQLVATPHGLSPDELTWTGPGTVVASYLQLVRPGRSSHARGGEAWVWDVAQAAPRRADGIAASAGGWGVPAGGRVLLGDRRLQVRDGASLEVLDSAIGHRHVSDGGSGTGVAISPDGTRVAGLWTRRQNLSDVPTDVVVAPLDDPAAATRFPGTEAVWLEGWRDAGHVVATGYPGGDRSQAKLLEVEVTSGQVRTLSVMAPGLASRPQWATDLLGSPVVDRPAPPRPLDPRWVTGGLVVLVVAGPIALWGWRRRVRP